MNLLNACLALALTLGVFASVVTVLVEMIHQIVQQRAKDLRGMLGYVFDKSFPEELLKQIGPDAADLRKDFAYALGSDKVLGELVRSHGLVLRLASKWIANTSSMTIEDLLRRLSRPEVYEKYLGPLDIADRGKILKSMVVQFGRAETAISEFFRVRAKLLSYLMGVSLAVTVNVDAVRLFEYFTANPVATEAAIARLQGMTGELKPAGQAGVATPPSLTPEQRQEISAMLYRLRASQTFGLPVGWAYYPYCLPQQGVGRLDPQCPAIQLPNSASDSKAGEAVYGLLENIHSGGRPMFWLLSVIVTGFLIGLGGPYWFDLAMSLSRFRDFLKNAQVKPAAPAVPPPEPDELVAVFIKKMGQVPTSDQEGKS